MVLMNAWMQGGPEEEKEWHGGSHAWGFGFLRVFLDFVFLRCADFHETRYSVI